MMLMLSPSIRLPIRLATRASAGAHANSAASVSEVWAVLADAQRWAEVEPFVRSVGPADDLPAALPGDDVEPGQQFRAQLRLVAFEVPVEVDHVVDRSSIAVSARLLPGLSEEVEHFVIPSASGGSLLVVRLTLHGPLALPVSGPELPDRAQYRADWSALHGGFDPAGSPFVNGWLTVMEVVARPLARRGVSPNLLTAVGLGVAAASLPAAALAGAKRRWGLAAGAAVAASGLFDGLDGAVATLSARTTPWGFVLDSLADRGADAFYLAALQRVGAPRGLVTAAAGAIVTLEYSRARAGNAGFGEIGVVTVGERPTRIAVTSAGLVMAGLFPSRARLSAVAAAASVAALSAVGAGQFLRKAAAELTPGR
jgi:phosphatidylglycerophosphate synthase